MSLEVGTYLSSLVSANPLSSDQVAQGDDHIRLIKTLLANTFPNAQRAFRFPTVSASIITGSIALDATYDNTTIRADATLGTLTVTLPSSGTIYEGWSCRVIKTDSGVNAVKVSGAGGNTIRDYNDFFLLEKYEGARFEYMGSIGWMVQLDVPEPLGFVKMWPLPTVPPKFLKANGALISRTTYPELNTLYSAQGYPYGSGDGSTTFQLPDYRGKFARFVADGSANDPDRTTRTSRGDTGATAGDVVGTNQADEFETHTHVQQGTFNTTNNGAHNHSTPNAGGLLGNIRTDASNVAADATTGTTSTEPNHNHSVTLSGQTQARGGNETRPINIYVFAIVRAWR